MAMNLGARKVVVTIAIGLTISGTRSRMTFAMVADVARTITASDLMRIDK